MKSFKVWNLLYVFAATAITLSLLVFTNQGAPAVITAASTQAHSQMVMAGMSMDDMDMSGMDMANMPASHSSNSANSSTSQSVAASGPTVEVGPNGNFVFEPAVITITVGETVTWHWATGGHSVTSDTPGLFDTGTNGTSHTFSYQFNTPGTYDYHCTPHQSIGMVGQVVVVSPSPAVITSLTPNTDQQNSPSFTLEVDGSNFASDAEVHWNGVARPTTFLSSTTLLATITGPADLSTVGDTGVTVLNSADMTTSAPMTFTVTAGCTATVVNKKTDTNVCGELRSAIAASPPATITFALLVGDQINITTNPITLASGITLTAPCSSGPTITLRSTSAANNFVLTGGVNIRGLLFSRVGGSGGILPVVQASTQNGPNHLSCSKISRT